MRPLLGLILAAALGAADFNGTTSYANATMTSGATHTYCAWVYALGYGEGNFGRVVGIDDHVAMFVSSTSDRIYAQYNAAGTSRSYSNSGISLSTWYLFCMARTAGDGGPRLYRGTVSAAMAELAYTGRVDAAPDVVTETGAIGNDADGDRTWNGSIAHVRIYNTTLTLAQTEMIRRGFEPLLANLTNYWPLMGNPVGTSDLVGSATLTLSNVAAGANAPVAPPWGWWAWLNWWRSEWFA